MKTPVSSDAHASTAISRLLDEPSERRKRIRRLVVMILLISVAVHGIAGVGAAAWVIARYLSRPPMSFLVRKNVQMPAEEREHPQRMESVESLRSSPVYDVRIRSLRPARLVLPNLPEAPLDTLPPLDVEALIADPMEGVSRPIVGEASDGTPLGDPSTAETGLLAGKFYDLKQTRAGAPTGISREEYVRMVNQAALGNSDAVLKRFYRADRTLYLPRVAIPPIEAEEAPRAFGVEGRIQARMWLAVYRGRMVAPESGTFRFLGFADDVLIVKVAGRMVFNGSLEGGTRGAGKVGRPFTVEEGKAYDIEVLVGELPGGWFSAWLQIQKQERGAEPYWFRMTDQPVSYRQTRGDANQRMPVGDAQGPVWRSAPIRRDLQHGL